MKIQLAPALLTASFALAVWNWFLTPQRALAWSATLFFVGCMAAALIVTSRRANNAAEPIRRAVVFAGLMLVVALTAKLVVAFGGPGNVDISRRTTMILLGVLMAMTGNEMPKTLTPLSALQCDPARIQAFQRFAGWTWVLTGLSFSTAWVVLPMTIARPVSTVLLLGGMFLIATQLMRLRFSRQKKA